MAHVRNKKIISKDILAVLGRACIAATLSYCQAGMIEGMERAKQKQRIHIGGSGDLVAQNPVRILQESFNKYINVYVSEYQAPQGKTQLTQGWSDSVRNMFTSLANEQKVPFISALRNLYEQKKESLELGDQRILDSLITGLEQVAKNINTREMIPYNQEQKQEINPFKPGLPHIPRLPIYDEPVALTQGELLAGGNPTPVQLTQKTLANELTNAQKQCFQFVDMQHRPLVYNNKPASCYDLSTLQNHLNLTEKIYGTAIEQIQKKAYRSIRTTLNAQHIDESVIRTLLANYLDETNNEKVIDVTGSSLKAEEAQAFNYFMTLCNAVYTDFYTREFLNMQDLPSVKKKWNEVIRQHNEIIKLRDTVEKIREKYESLVDQKTLYEEKSEKYELSRQAVGLERAPQVALIEHDYKGQLKLINSFLQSIHREPVTDESLENIVHLVKRLNEIKQEIDSEYSWYFETITKTPRDWAIELGAILDYMNQKLLGGEQHPKIPEFNDVSGKKHQLTAKAVVASSFLNKAKLSKNKNITILDVGFRNEEKFGSAWNNFVTHLMRIKANKKAWFQDWGEVDYIAYIEKDASPARRDKLVIVYAGSNSQMDWGIDFTIGNSAFLGLSVHEGIGWLFQTTTNTYHSVLMERIRNYYKENEKPRELEIITTGHSLGAGLAELAAYYYKTKQLGEFADILDPSNISVKTYTFAAPAIVDKNSKITIESALGKDNIYRIWVTNDPVAVLSEAFKIQGGKHIGKSYPLYNIQNLAFNFLDWWGPHGADRYLSYLHALSQTDYMTQYQNLISILNNYITTTNLYIYKMNRNALLPIIEEVKKKTRRLPITLHQGLAEHIIKYSPTTINLKPYPTVEGILAHSPRYAAALSPRFEVEVEGPVTQTSSWTTDRYEINAIFKISVGDHEKAIKFPIVASTGCSTRDIQKFLTGLPQRIDLDHKSAEKLSCGSCMAKRIFVSQYTEYPSAYKGGVLGVLSPIRQTAHQDTLTKMFTRCVTEEACTPEYLKETGVDKNPLEQTLEILEKVGLGEAFKNKKVYFSRFEEQDQLAKEERPGIDLTAQYKESEAVLDESTLRNLIEMLPEDYARTINFTDEEIGNEESICSRIINATNDKNHWNLLTHLLNEADMTSLIREHNIHHGDTGKTIEQLFDNFQINLIAMLKVFYEKKYAASRIGYRPAQINERNLVSDLEELKEQVLKNSSWNIIEKGQDEKGAHLLPGVKEGQLALTDRQVLD